MRMTGVPKKRTFPNHGGEWPYTGGAEVKKFCTSHRCPESADPRRLLVEFSNFFTGGIVRVPSRIEGSLSSGQVEAH